MFRHLDEYVEITSPGEGKRRAERVLIVSIDEARQLLRRFARGEARSLRVALARLAPEGDVSRFSDDDVFARAARALAFGQLVAYRHKAPVFTVALRAVAQEVTRATTKLLTWVEIVLVDDDGVPVPNEAYLLRLPDGTELPGRLNDKGRAFVDQIPGGQCKVSFPDLDASEWQPV